MSKVLSNNWKFREKQVAMCVSAWVKMALDQWILRLFDHAAGDTGDTPNQLCVMWVPTVQWENLRCLRKQKTTCKTHNHHARNDQYYSMIRGADMALRRPCGWWKYFQRVLSATSPHTGFALSFTKGALRVYPTYANGRFSSTSNWGFARSKSRTHFQNLIQVWVITAKGTPSPLWIGFSSSKTYCAGHKRLIGHKRWAYITVFWQPDMYIYLYIQH